ncbi:MAG: FadR family transcriptional regulator, partial [Planctomycetes bacterium]|nr:FadR family transcriptional regulator [Planctomycetota bacterium]
MQIKAVEKTNLVELVEQKILDIVRKNNLSVGDSLPGELELTEGLGVSRSVVREALSRLRMLGLLESRKRRG